MTILPALILGTSIAFYQSGDGVVSDMGHLSGSGIFLDKIQVHFGYVALGENSNETIKIYNSRSENITLSPDPQLSVQMIYLVIHLILTPVRLLSLHIQ